MRFAYHHALSPDTVPAAKKRSLEPVNDDIRTLLRIGITNNDQFRSLVSQLPLCREQHVRRLFFEKAR